MLAAPGMPLHKSPFITTRQATSLLSALCEPLVQVSVGRLTRRLESPTLLRPTQDKGVISLWLLPNDDLSLVWQGRATDTSLPGLATGTGAPIGVQPGAAAVTSSSNTDMPSPTATNGSTSSLPAVRAVQDVERAGCEVTVWEELARFPSGMHPGSNDPVITIHMLRGDASARAFYIRPRGDATGTHAQTVAAAGGILPAGTVANSRFDSSSEDGRRMYFWLTGNDLATAVRNLGRLKSLVKRPPTLSKRSGVPQRQLNQISSWLHQLDAVAHQQTASLAGGNTTADTNTVPVPPQDGSSIATILGRQGQTPAQAARVVQQDGDHLTATGAVSATAAAVYRDRRFRISFPCAITVGASVILKGSPTGGNVADTETAGKELTTCATQHAKQIAEDVARRTVDLIGRRNLEETICESLIRSVKAHRAKAKAEVQAQKDKQSRQLQAQQAQYLIQRAVEHAVAHGGTPPQSCKLKMTMTVNTAGAAVGTSVTALPDAAVVGNPVGTPSPAPTVPRLSLLGSGSGSSTSESDAGSVESPTTPRRVLSEEGPASVPDGLSGPARPPTPPPAAGPTSRVTIDDLQTLLNTGGSAAGQSATGKVNIGDLPNLLQSQQPTSRDH